jgi:hypothetical protein
MHITPYNEQKNKDRKMLCASDENEQKKKAILLLI